MIFRISSIPLGRCGFFGLVLSIPAIVLGVLRLGMTIAVPGFAVQSGGRNRGTPRVSLTPPSGDTIIAPVGATYQVKTQEEI
jgi:hypothetical protein